MSTLKVRALLAALIWSAIASVSAATISVGTYPVTPVPSYIPALPTDTFLVPVQITEAAHLQNWQFDLLFDNAVVEVVDPSDGSSGIYGAEFTAGDALTRSFILAGLPLNFLGLVDDVAGSHPDLVDGASGDGVLAYILFGYLPGQHGNDPDFSIANVVIQQVPEPAAVSLLAPALLLLGAQRRRSLRASLIQPRPNRSVI